MKLFLKISENIEIDKNMKNKKQQIQIKDTLASEFGVEDHPKLDKCFELAWEYGHGHGYSEIRKYFIDLVELIL